MRYARSDIASYVPPGGVCPGHAEPADSEDAHFSVDCVVCDPHLALDPLWAGHPADVPFTETEQRVADNVAREAQEAQARFAMAMAQAGMSEVTKRMAESGLQPAPAPAPETPTGAPKRRSRAKSPAQA